MNTDHHVTKAPQPASATLDDDLSSTIAAQYDRFQDSLESLDKDRKYLNYGFTIHPEQSYEDRQETLCLETFRAAEVGPSHRIVDVGFGSGEQDFLWADRFPFQHLHGFNISRAQVEYARRRAEQRNDLGRLQFSLGRAETLPEVEANSVDRVLAVECAFYFHRAQFYARAAEVLRQDGRLVLADICFADFAKAITWAGEDLRRVGTLSANRQLWQRHFRTLEVRPIHREVRPGVDMTVRQIRHTVRGTTFSAEQKAQWRSMALWSRLVSLGLRSRVLRYDLIVLERR